MSGCSGRGRLPVVLLLLLGGMGSAAAELDQTAKQSTLSATDLPWTLVLPQGFRLLVNQPRPDGRGGYYDFTDDVMLLNLSCTLAPARTCQTGEACRAAFWAQRPLAIRNPQAVQFFEQSGFAVVEYLLPEFKGLPVQQFNFSAHHVLDGYWIDLHLSKVWFEPKDRALFLKVLDAITFAPKR